MPSKQKSVFPRSIIPNAKSSLVPLSELQTLWQPYFVLMKVLGLVNFYGNSSRSFNILWNIYALSLLIFLWSFVIYRFILCQKFHLGVNEDFLVCCINAFFNFTMVIARTNFVLINYHKSGLKLCLRLWTDLTFSPKYVKTLERSIKTYAWAILAACAVMLVFKTLGKFIHMYFNNVFYSCNMSGHSFQHSG